MDSTVSVLDVAGVAVGAVLVGVGVLMVIAAFIISVVDRNRKARSRSPASGTS